MKKVFIQIGTNNGDDLFLRRVKRENPDMVILVEPNKEWRNTIRKNYGMVSSAVIIKNVAITDRTGDVVKLSIPKLGKNGLAKNGYGYNTGNYSLLPMDDWGEDLVTMEVPTMSFADLCDSFGITTIDYLQIDTEGYDAQIIKTIDFKKYNIKELEYEYWGFPEDCYTKYGEKGKQYGLNGMIEIEKLLTSLGYSVETNKNDDMNRIAKK